MAKKKTTRRTPEQQRAYDERTKVINEILEPRWREVVEQHEKRKKSA